MEENNNRNFILAIVLSGLVLLAWQFLVMNPKIEADRLKKQQAAEFEAKQRQAAQKSGTQNKTASGQAAAPVPGSGSAPLPSTAQQGSAPQPSAGAPGSTVPSIPGSAPTVSRSRQLALRQSPRFAIDTPSLTGSIALKGGRIDDLVLRKYRVKADKDAANVEYFSPSGSPHPLYAEYGWSAAPGDKIKLPNASTLWTAQGSSALTPTSPVTLSYDNGEGVTFKRTISVDENYMFSVQQSVENGTDRAITLYPYALISRHETPKIEGFFIMHEGLIGVLGKEGLQEIDYSTMLEDRSKTFRGVGGWLGITDKYWATAIIPRQDQSYEAHFSGRKTGNNTRYQTDYLLGAVSVPAGGAAKVEGQLFAGAKKAELVDGYAAKHKIQQFDLMIDWGWFYFITKPLFHVLAFFHGLIGNFGVAILLVTVLIKLVFYPLANKSYESMSKMKKLQPDMERIRKRFADDKARQQQEMMKLYQESGANPLSGCLPILIQIPVFFALYKVLYVSLEMRHAPFFGWIQDLSAPDPTSIFNLFGLIPIDLPQFLMVGIWPLIMGVTMWVQMKLNPQQSDPTQQMIFNWMPVMFTFLLAAFPAGLVIYWAWNNLLSVLQQWWIMKKNDVEVDLLENTGIRKLLAKAGEKAGKS